MDCRAWRIVSLVAPAPSPPPSSGRGPGRPRLGHLRLRHPARGRGGRRVQALLGPRPRHGLRGRSVPPTPATYYRRAAGEISVQNGLNTPCSSGNTLMQLVVLGSSASAALRLHRYLEGFNVELDADVELVGPSIAAFGELACTLGKPCAATLTGSASKCSTQGPCVFRVL